MKIPHRVQLCLALLVAPLGLIATPVTVFNDTQTAIFGSGNPNGGWVTSSDSSLGLLVGLRAKDRATGATPNNGNGTFTFATAPAPRGLWNYEFTVNTGSSPLTSFDFFLSVDRDASAGVSLFTVNPLTHWLDNSYGTAATLNGQGVEGPFLFFGGTNTIAQNSQNITFGGLTPYPGGALALSPNASYRFELYAVAPGAGSNGSRLASTAIDVVVGNGGVSVPDTGSTIALLAVTLCSMLAFGRSFGQRHELASVPA